MQSFGSSYLLRIKIKRSPARIDIPPLGALVRGPACYHLQVFLYSFAVGICEGRADYVIIHRNRSEDLEVVRGQLSALL